MKIAVYIDYDNLSERQKTLGILDITTRALMRTTFIPQVSRGSCEIRIYGGWFEGANMTVLAQKLEVEIRNDFPKIIKIPINGAFLSIASTAELALSMMEEPNYMVFNTYRKKGKPSNVRVQKPEDVGCMDSSCPLPLAKKLLKSGGCPISSCSIKECNLVYRHEQKIVDTMLTCDIIYAEKISYNHLVILSDDDDFIPALRTVLLRGMLVARFHPKPSVARVNLGNFGGRLTDTDL